MKKLIVMLITMMFAVTVFYYDGLQIKKVTADAVTWGDKKVTLRTKVLPGSREVIGKVIRVIPLRQVISIDYMNF